MYSLRVYHHFLVASTNRKLSINQEICPSIAPHVFPLFKDLFEHRGHALCPLHSFYILVLNVVFMNPMDPKPTLVSFSTPQFLQQSYLIPGNVILQSQTPRILRLINWIPCNGGYSRFKFSSPHEGSTKTINLSQ